MKSGYLTLYTFASDSTDHIIIVIIIIITRSEVRFVITTTPQSQSEQRYKPDSRIT